MATTCLNHQPIGKTVGGRRAEFGTRRHGRDQMDKSFHYFSCHLGIVIEISEKCVPVDHDVAIEDSASEFCFANVVCASIILKPLQIVYDGEVITFALFFMDGERVRYVNGCI